MMFLVMMIAASDNGVDGMVVADDCGQHGQLPMMVAIVKNK